MVGDLDGVPPLDAAAIRTPEGVTPPGPTTLELWLRPSGQLVRINLGPVGRASLLAVNVDADATDELVVGEPDVSPQPGAPPTGAAVVLFDPGSYVDRTEVGAWPTMTLLGDPRSRFGEALAAADLDGAAPADVLFGAPGYDPSGAVYGVAVFTPGVVTQAKIGARWVLERPLQASLQGFGEAVAAGGRLGLTVACVGTQPSPCKERSLAAFDLSRYAGGVEIEVPLLAVTNTAALASGDDELVWRDDLDADGAADPVLTGGTFAQLTGTTPPGWPGAGPAVASGGVALRGDHLLLAVAEVVYELPDPRDADLATAVDTWPLVGAARLVPADDWDGDDCPDTLVSGVGAVGLIPGACEVPDTVEPDTVDTVDTPAVADTDAVDSDTDPSGADDTAAPCEPMFGWSCSTAPAAPPWLLLAALLWRRKVRAA